MAHNPHAHLQKEIDSLRKQLIQERDQRRFDDSLLVTTTIKQAEERTLERCIVECMEEANAPTYTEEERVAILTATERLKEMRAERQREREGREQILRKQEQESLYQQVLLESMKHKNVVYRTAMDQAMMQGVVKQRIWWDEAGQVMRTAAVSDKESFK
jgi:outer membrane biosynthesis protein TonB